ncbi:hypothetical protein BG004_001025, partial [Podila humilis]
MTSTLPQDTHNPTSNQDNSNRHVIDLTGPDQLRPTFPTTLPSQSVEYVNLESDDDEEEVQFIRETGPASRPNNGHGEPSSSSSPSSRTTFESLYNYMAGAGSFIRTRTSPAASRRMPFVRRFHPFDFESESNPFLVSLENENNNNYANGSRRQMFPAGGGSSTSARRRSAMVAAAAAAAAASSNMETSEAHRTANIADSVMDYDDFPYINQALGHVHTIFDRVNRTFSYYGGTGGGGGSSGTTPAATRRQRGRNQSSIRHERGDQHIHENMFDNSGRTSATIQQLSPRSMMVQQMIQNEMLAWALTTTQHDAVEAPPPHARAATSKRNSKQDVSTELPSGFTRTVEATTRLACPRCKLDFGTAEKTGGVTKLYVIMGCGHVICQDCVEPLFQKKVYTKSASSSMSLSSTAKASLSSYVKTRRMAATGKGKGKGKARDTETETETEAEAGPRAGTGPGTGTEGGSGATNESTAEDSQEPPFKM